MKYLFCPYLTFCFNRTSSGTITDQQADKVLAAVTSVVNSASSVVSAEGFNSALDAVSNVLNSNNVDTSAAGASLSALISAQQQLASSSNSITAGAAVEKGAAIRGLVQTVALSLLDDAVAASNSDSGVVKGETVVSDRYIHYELIQLTSLTRGKGMERENLCQTPLLMSLLVIFIIQGLTCQFLVFPPQHRLAHQQQFFRLMRASSRPAIWSFRMAPM